MISTVSGISLVFICGAAFVALSTTPADATDRKVKCDNGNQTIQKALDKAKDGDTIEVTGSCTEAIVIDKDRITLRCLDGASITGPANPAAPTATTVQVRGNNARIEGCTISGPASNGSGIAILWSGSAALADNSVSGLRTGMTVSHSSYGRITGNEVTGNSTGLVLASGSAADVASNDISGNSGTGVVVTRGGSGEFVGNTVDDNGGSGFVVVQGGIADFSGDTIFGTAANHIEGNIRGIFCSSNATLNFENPQDFGAGNTFGNTLFLGDCSVSGAP